MAKFIEVMQLKNQVVSLNIEHIQSYQVVIAEVPRPTGGFDKKNVVRIKLTNDTVDSVFSYDQVQNLIKEANR